MMNNDGDNRCNSEIALSIPLMENTNGILVVQPDIVQTDDRSSKYLADLMIILLDTEFKRFHTSKKQHLTWMTWLTGNAEECEGSGLLLSDFYNAEFQREGKKENLCFQWLVTIS